MFAVVYSFYVKPEQEQSFIQLWSELTILLRENANSMGSRLHLKEPNHFIAYAQWPDKDSWENAGKKLPKEAQKLREKMREN